MQALTVGCQFAFGIGVLPPGCFVPLALAPAQAGVAVFFDASFLVVVLWIVRPALPVHLALQSAFFAGIGTQLLTERDETRLRLSRHDSERCGSDIQADDVRTRLLMLWLDERMAL